MAEYFNVTQPMIEEYLLPQGFIQVSLPGTVELVYSKRADVKDGVKLPDMPELSIRVFTGINPDGNSRGVGEDAMRVEVAYAEPVELDEYLRRESVLTAEAPYQPYQRIVHGANPPAWAKWICRVGGSKRVHRVVGWKANLQDRLDRWSKLLGPSCPVCGCPTVERRPRKGQTWKPFYSCVHYRTKGCKGTVNIVPAKG